MSKTASRTNSTRTKSESAVIRRSAAHILVRMRTKTTITMVVVAMLAMVQAAFAEYDCQIISSGIGDSNLLTLGGFTLAKPISIDLMPTNAPNAGARYSVRCQVVYKDRNLPRPETDEAKELARATGQLLNSWLVNMAEDLYTGAEFTDLLVKYYGGSFTEDLNKRFAAYVAERIGDMKSRAQIDIDTVTVTVNAEGEFRAVLAELLKQQRASQGN